MEDNVRNQLRGIGWSSKLIDKVNQADRAEWLNESFKILSLVPIFEEIYHKTK